MEGEGGFDGKMVAERATQLGVPHHHAHTDPLDDPAAAQGLNVTRASKYVIQPLAKRVLGSQ
jgi:hypothetical protein